MAEKPLMLKDYLELESHSDSFRCSTMRHLLDAELGPTTRSKSPLSKLIHALKLLSPSSSPAPPSFSRSLSKRLKRSFWKKRGEQEEVARASAVKVRDIVRLSSFNNGDERRRSFEFPSPIVSSCSSSSSCNSSRWSSSPGSEFLISSVGSCECFPAVNGEKDSPRQGVGAGATTGREESKDLKSSKRMEGDDTSEEEKEQLSPVSVMDFPFHDEDDDEEDELQQQEESTSNSFHQSLANIERTKQQLLQKIRRFECLVDMDPIDLDHLFQDQLDLKDQVSSDDEDENGDVKKNARKLLKQLQCSSQDIIDEGIEKLLMDFFVDNIITSDDHNYIHRWKRCININRRIEDEEQFLLETASNWINCQNNKVADHMDEYLKETEKNGRWRCFQEEEEEIASDAEAVVLEWLMDELIGELWN